MTPTQTWCHWIHKVINGETDPDTAIKMARLAIKARYKK